MPASLTHGSVPSLDFQHFLLTSVETCFSSAQLYHHRASKNTNRCRELLSCTSSSRLIPSNYGIMSDSRPQDCPVWFTLSHLSALLNMLNVQHSWETHVRSFFTLAPGKRQRDFTDQDDWCSTCWCWYEAIVFWCKCLARVGVEMLSFFLNEHLNLQTS